MRILITGATGFIGSKLTSLLLKDDCQIYAVSRRRCQPNLKSHHNLTHICADLFDGTGFDEIPWSELDVIIHLASSGVKATNRVWSESLNVNVVGTQRLLTSISRRCAKQPIVLFARSFYEHLTDQIPSLLENPYIATKLAANSIARLWAEGYRGQTIFATLFQVYGPGDDSGSVLNYAARQLKAGEQAVFGCGRGLRDWIFIDDAVQALRAALTNSTSKSQEIDIGTGKLTSIRSMVETIAEVGGASPHSLVFDPSRDRPDVEATRGATLLPINWAPAVDIRSGLSALYANL